MFDQEYPHTVSSVSNAAKIGDVAILKALLEDGKSPNTQDNKGWIAIHHAVSGKHLDCMKVLLERDDASVDAQAHDKTTSLDIICSKWLDHNTQLTGLQLLLNAKCSLTPVKDCYTYFLNDLIQLKNIEAVKLLLEHGADVNYYDGYTGSPLFTTITQCSGEKTLEMVELLIASGAKDLPEVSEHCVLHQCVLSAHPNAQILKTLLALPKFHQFINRRDISTMATPLTLACRKEWWEGISLLLAAGADVNLRDQDDNLPLDYLAQIITDELYAKDKSIFERLFMGTNEKSRSETRPDSERTPYFNALVRRSCFDVCHFVLNEGVAADAFAVPFPEVFGYAPMAHLREWANRKTLVTPLANLAYTIDSDAQVKLAELLIERGAITRGDCAHVDPMLMLILGKNTWLLNSPEVQLFHRFLDGGPNFLKTHTFLQRENLFQLPFHGSHNNAFIYILTKIVPADVVFTKHILMDLAGYLGKPCKRRRERPQEMNLFTLLHKLVPCLPLIVISKLYRTMSHHDQQTHPVLIKWQKIVATPTSLMDSCARCVRKTLWKVSERPLCYSINKLCADKTLPGLIRSILLCDKIQIEAARNPI